MEAPRPLTAEEARTVGLSHSPIKRLGQLAEYGAAFCQRKIGWSLLPSYLTRGDLVRTAEAHETARELMSVLNQPSSGE